MLNLIKNTIRSFKKNAVSITGLVFLTFVSCSAFTLLNATSKNISSTYASLKNDSNLHDFVVNEQYDTGNFSFKLQSSFVGESSDQKVIPWPTQTGGSGVWTRVYCYELDTSSMDRNSIIYEFWNEHKDDSSFDSFLKPAIIIKNSSAQFTYEDGDKTSSKTYSECYSEFSEDFEQINSGLSDATNSLLNEATNVQTPMLSYLNGLNADARKFKSLNLVNSLDNIYYKIINDNSTFSIDKVHVFSGRNNFNYSASSIKDSDFNPIPIDKQAYINNQNTSNKEYLSIDDIIQYATNWLNSSRNFTLNNNDLNALGAFWAILANGYTSNQAFNSVINTLNGFDWANLTAQDQTTIHNTLATYDEPFNLYQHGYKWVLTTEASSIDIDWYLQDWTSYFSVVNPQYAQHKGLNAANVKNFSASSWDELKIKLNTFSEQKREAFINQYVTNYPSTTVDVGGALPTIIIGVGLSADFIYPIVDFAHLSPNSNRECLVYGNEQFYTRVSDANRSSQIESFIVGKLPNGANKNEFINKVNTEASSLCNFPAGVKAAYLANDTSDVLNPSALRIIFIPNLVKGITVVSWLFSIFIMLLCLFICTIILFSYINSLRQQLGIMRANGIRKRSIIGSLLPFAILPGFVATTLGYFGGLLLQKPALLIFKNYWTIPTTLSFFNFWLFLGLFVIFAVIYTIVIVVTSTIILKQDTNHLIRIGSEYKVNIVARKIKKPLKKTPIMFRFRASLAFNSISKLLTLSLISVATCSSLIVGFGLVNKFNSAKNQTFNSRNYSFAVDLQTPTNAGGQYYPIDASLMGCSGFIKSDDDNKQVWIPNNHYAPHAILFSGSDKNDFYTSGDNSFGEVTNSTPSSSNYWSDQYGIGKKYYALAYSLTDVANSLTGGPDIEKGFFEYNNTGIFSSDDGGQVHGNIITPNMGDSTGQNSDINYLKNSVLQKFCCNYSIGVGSLTTNPWLFAQSLLPESEANIVNKRTQGIEQLMGQVEGTDINNTMWSSNSHCSSVTKEYHNKFDTKGFFNNFAPDSTYFIADRNNQLYPHTEDVDKNGVYVNPPHYTANKRSIILVDGLCVQPKFMAFMNAFYSEFPIDKDKSTAMDNDYTISYNQIPLKLNSVASNNNDETYTHVDGLFHNDNIHIVGIKPNTKYVSLIDANNKNLLSNLDINNIHKNLYPIIINQYAAFKYGLSIGKTINVEITNQANRYNKLIGNNEDVDGCPNASVQFEVVGISQTFQNSEFFINQQLANWLLGLRSKLTDLNNADFPANQNLHTYYNNTYLLPSEDYLTTQNPWESFTPKYYSGYNDNHMGCDLNASSATTDIANPTSYANNQLQTTPYGFNGVFTKKSTGGNVLSSTTPLYSLSGIYPGSDRYQSKKMENVLSVGTNLAFANYVSGVRDQTIANAYQAWKTATGGNVEPKFNDYLGGGSKANVSALCTKLAQIYGETSFCNLVTNANDKANSNTIFNNLASTTNEIEIVVLVTFCLMFLLIMILMCWLVITSSRRLASMLKALGYNDRENALSFMSLYLPMLAIGFGFSIPLSYGVMYALRLTIFNHANLLISAALPWYSFIGAIGVTFSLIASCVLYAFYSFRKIDVALAIKE